MIFGNDIQSLILPSFIMGEPLLSIKDLVNKIYEYQPILGLLLLLQEFIAAITANKKAYYLRSILNQIALLLNEPTTIYKDNTSTTIITVNKGWRSY